MKIILKAVAAVMLFFLVSNTESASKKAECEDKAGTKRCLSYKTYYSRIGKNLCATIKKRNCKLTCKLCKPAQACETSTYGCCWDKRTKAKGPGREGCPYCKDSKRSLCKTIISRLLTGGRISKKQACSYRWTSKNCPQTCGMCALPAMAYNSCTDSIFGCCWNYQPALGINGEGCEVCEDTYPHVCSQFHYYCNKEVQSKMFMNLHCPLTCGKCVKGRRLLLDPYGKRHKKY